MKVALPANPPENSTQSDALAVPKATLGEYRLLRKLGSGGMANVYLGQRFGAGGAVEFAAVKVMQPQLLSDRHSTSMFFDEARITASIRHPAICRVLDFGVDDGLPYLVTEYVLGEMLCDLMEALHRNSRGRAIAGAVTAHIVAQACEGLHAAHEACDEDGSPLNVVHRDMAPQNIMVGYDGHVRVLDFGIARSADQQHQTQHGVLRGRFAYMAPEQLEGGPIDRRGDIWSLGVILWEGATGRRLFKRDSVSETMRAVIADPLPPMLRSAEDIHHGLLDIVERSVVRDATRRYATARKMGNDLSELATTGPLQLQVLMQQTFASRFEAKRRMLGGLSGAHRAVAADGTTHRSVGPLPTQQRSESGFRMSTGSMPKAPPMAPSASGAAPKPQSSDSASDGQSLALPSTAPSFAPSQIALPGALTWRPSMPRRKLLAAVLVSTAVALALLTLDSPSREAADGRRARGPEQLASRKDEAPRGAVHGQAPQQLAVNVRLGEVSLSELGASAVLRVDGIAIGTTSARLALPEGPHVIEVWNGPPDLPVVIPVQVIAGQTLTVSVPSKL